MNENNNKLAAGGTGVKALVGAAVAAVIFLVLSWAYFYPNDVRGDVMQQGDIVQGLAVGHEGSVHQEQTGEVTRWTNGLFGGMPTFQINPTYSTNAWLGPVASVISLRFLGTPEPVSWLWMLMLGFFILMLACDMRWYYAVLGALGYAFSSYFVIIMGAGHIWKLLTLCYIPPTLAGVVLAYRGKWLTGGAVTALFLALQLLQNHVQMTYYSAFIIAALAIGYLCQAIRQKQVAQWAVASAVLLGAAVLGVAANAPNLYLTQKYAQETMRGGHSDLKPAQGSADAGQTDATGGLSKEYITQWSYGKAETFTLLVPNVNGGASMKPQRSEQDPSTIANVGMTLDKTKKGQDYLYGGDPVVSQTLPYFTQYFGDQPMTNGPVYVGALIFALFLLGCIVVKGPVKWALVAVTLLSIGLSWGHNMMWLTDLFIDYFPMYNKFRTVSSILVIAEITMPMLAALGLKEAFGQDDFLKRNAKALYAAFGIPAVLCVLFAVAPGMFVQLTPNDQQAIQAIGQQLGQTPGSLIAAIDDIRGSLVSSDAWRSLAFIVIGFAVLLGALRSKGKVSPAVPVLLLAALVVADMYMVDKRYVSQESFIAKSDVKPAVIVPDDADKQILADTAQNYRVADLQGFMAPNASYLHKAVGGYHAAKLRRYNDLIERQLTKGGQLNIAIDSMGQPQWDKMGVWNMLNTKYFKLSPQQVMQNPAACGNAWWVGSVTYVDSADDEMAFLDNFAPDSAAVANKEFQAVLGQAAAPAPGDTIVETSYAPNRLTYLARSASGGVAVFSEVYFPWGWRATIDGKEAQIGRVNYVLRALRIPAGEHKVEFTFFPDEVDTTNGIATAAIVAIFLLVIAAVAVPMVRRKTKQ